MADAKNAGLTEVTLAKDWGKHKAGKTLRVDPRRAEQLKKDGFLGRSTEPRTRASGGHGPRRGQG